MARRSGGHPKKRRRFSAGVVANVRVALNMAGMLEAVCVKQEAGLLQSCELLGCGQKGEPCFRLRSQLQQGSPVDVVGFRATVSRCHADTVNGACAADGLLEGLDASVASDGWADR